MQIYADGSGIEEMAGAVAVLHRGQEPPKMLR
jgi:hypothetical protein